MPNFSVYAGQIPACLNPGRLSHYLMLAYWVYFYPTALKSYLYQIDSELYRAPPGLQIFDTVKRTPYRNLYLMIPCVSLGFSILLGFIILKILSWQTGRGINGLGWFIGAIAGVIIGELFFILFFTIFGTLVSIARGLITGSIVGIISGIPNSILISVILGISESLELRGIASQMNAIFAISLAFGLAVGATVGMAIGGVIGAMVALTLGAAGSLIIGIVFSFLIGAIPAIATTKTITAIAFGLTIGIAASGSSGADVNPARNVMNGIVMCGAVSVAFGFCFGWPLGLLTAAVAISCALRFPVYGLEFLWILLSCNHPIRHPLEWDELLIFPIPATQKRLTLQLQRNEPEGIFTLCHLVRNPFQRWVVQRVLKTYLHQQSSPVRSLYTLLSYPVVEAYISAPVTQSGWDQLPEIKQVLLAELYGKWVNCATELTGSISEQLIYRLTLPFRSAQATPLTHFAGLLLQLLDCQISTPRNEILSLLFSKSPIYNGLTIYSEGQEIQTSFEVMRSFLSCDRLSSLPQLIDITTKLPESRNAIRPPLMVALYHLRNISLDIVIYLTATSRVNQQAALLRANSALRELDTYVVTEVRIPEQILLRHIIQHWEQLIIQAGGEISRVEILSPVPNPYVVGNPVIGHLFVGREDILQQLQELWLNPQPPSIILYGQRRMGKSSILRNLKTQLGNQIIVVDFNMQIVGSVKSTNELLYALALEIYDSLPSILKLELEEPEQAHFNAHNPYQMLWRFLKRVDKIRKTYRFIIAVDEFELLEQLITENIVEQRLIGFWRGLIQTYPWFIMVFAGLHTLKEMREDYWSPLFSSITAVPVSFLSEGAVQRLVAQPSPDFDIEYDPEVVQAIYHLTHGQPYLVQLIGHTLVTHFNHQIFEERKQCQKRFTLKNLESVVNSPEFYRDGDAYFTGIWKQAEVSQPHGQLEILHQLCWVKLSQSQLVEKTTLDITSVRAVLEILKSHDVIRQENDCYTYTVELMQYWVQRMKVAENSKEQQDGESLNGRC